MRRDKRMLQRIKKIHLLLATVLVFAMSCAYADEPLAPPSEIIALSSNGKFKAVSSPESGKTLVLDSLDRKVWEVPGWHQLIFISNDGKSIAIGNDGIDLFPAYDPNIELVTFWNKGEKVRTVTLSDIVSSTSELKRSVAHYYWGEIEGIDTKGRLVIKRSDGKQFLFNMNTGIPE